MGLPLHPGGGIYLSNIFELMAAPKGNQFWLMADPDKIGRPPNFKTPSDLREAANKYFQWVVDNPITTTETTTTDKGIFVKSKTYTQPFTWPQLYVFLGVTTLDQYEKIKEFLGVYTHIRNTLKAQKFAGAAVGIFKENLIARDLGLAEQTKNENNHTLPEWMNEG